ncbi:MAG: ATP synthase F1 subunit epsilon [Oscillospiraceae bacterium]
MSEFKLQIVTPDGISFDGMVEQLTVKTVTGDIGILKNHISYVSPLAIGIARVKINGVSREAACNGGMVRASKEGTQVIATTFEWSDEIDIKRAQAAKEEALRRLQNKQDNVDLKLAELKLKRALNRLNVQR